MKNALRYKSNFPAIVRPASIIVTSICSVGYAHFMETATPKPTTTAKMSAKLFSIFDKRLLLQEVFSGSGKMFECGL